MKNKKIHVAVLFGGKSAEHEVSVRSAQSIISVLDKSKYDVTLVGIDKEGAWLPFSKTELLSSKKVLLGKQKNETSKALTPYGGEGFLVENEKRLGKVDVVFPILHGTFGEDGTIQGLFKIANVPFVGAGVLGSAVGMDKDVAKRLLRDAGLPTANFLVYKKHELKNIVFEKIKRKLGVPFFVKPANLGSSVGISKVHNKSEFSTAINSAFLYDNKILIEEYVKGKEIECSVLGNEKPIVSVCGEIVPSHEFYSYEAKYLDENGAMLSIPASISKQTSKKVQELALKAFKVLCCEGMARIDFFVTEDKKIFINEINTIPGFTSISMYPKLWEASGISYAKLVDMLISLAIERFEKEKKLRTSFD
ncbi:MAG: D-alanine--D-alanine ligase [Candidatus Vogelbacteria bacterium CG10_big_fil_rev_8_21_14_0_10_49_38]|uniref:D-alanine--D-alanine ligase n=1 Tax=Candidatus Vogelbacteria bacterium CG10_big_fil_rev_8_21_14_0_10_49_38 TaxID=1975043 RepID=A0A2H0RJG0_9BACT|nr:MAG: D-alanine--D-alanine ligase A [bacterium CG10_49_38]PIR45915.1 MAG: D-alanine--D-alanine ligase [Candidatus Vogelbacteria bacterium CG10_big_fil_rev_8_21_14_0_10_49_38]